MNVSKISEAFIYGFIFAVVAFLISGGGFRLDMEEDEPLVREELLESEFLKVEYVSVVEVRPLPNNYSQGCAKAPRRWRKYKIGSQLPGYFSYEIVGKVKGLGRRTWHLEYKVYYKLDPESKVTIISIKGPTSEIEP